MPKLTIIVRDDESELEARTYLEVFEDSEHVITAQVAKTISRLLKDIGYGDRDDRQQEG